MERIRPDDAQEWARWFRALSDASRLQVLNAIASHGPGLTIGELVQLVDIGQSTVSHHVRVLADAGFVIHVREGTTSRVSVEESCLSALPDAAAAILGAPPTTGG